MNLDEIDKKCFILALFIRDDGQRFLLGSGAYEFKDSQLHFSANTMSNDVVEVQGNDGYLLAGQVRRPTTQVFDGYIGDASINKPDIEGYRRDFFAFFQKNHFYTVVYIFPDGTSIQRRRGFIVDAGEVRELYQMFPEYHIGLNFEDVNYYKYSEDEDGNEQYAKSIDINISKAVSGGLIWDEVSQEQAYNHGTDFSISGTIESEPVDYIDLYGDTEQTTYSGKNLYDFDTVANAYNYRMNVTKGTNSWTFVPTATAEGVSCYGLLGTIEFKANQTYTISFDVTGDYKNFVLFKSTWETVSGTSTTNEQLTYTPTADSNLYLGFYVNSGTNKSCTVSNIQIEKGNQATSFEPYVGGTASPNPDYPQEVQVVTGRQVVTITDGGSQSQEYEINLGDIELCKIGDYQDYIYKSGNDWYVHKEIVKISPDGTETWNSLSISNPDYIYCYTSAFDSLVKPKVWNGLFSDKFVVYDYSEGGYEWISPSANIKGACFSNGDNSETINLRIICPKTTADSVGSFKTWLGNTRPVFYYPIKTPTDTQITNSALIAQLEALNSATTYTGVTWFKTESEYLPADTWAYVQIQAGGGVVWDNYGATWEEGGGGMIVNVNVDSIENVYPVWTVNGPTDTPILTNLTTGTSITYNGNITASQTLVVDMLNQTALLNGTSVIGKLSGDWIELAPGMNRMSYTATNEQTAPKSTLEWQEIVG